MIEVDEILKVINQMNKYLEGHYVLGGSWEFRNIDIFKILELGLILYSFK